LGRELISGAREAKKAVRQLARVLNEDLSSPIEKLDPSVEQARFLTELRQRLNESGAITLGYPTTSHKDLVNRATNRTRPFDSQGSGYRDSLIWESVVALAINADSKVILISEDKCFSNRKGELHSDLVAELQAQGLPSEKVALMKSLDKLVDAHVRPQLKPIIWDDPMKTLAQFGFDPEEAMLLALQDEYSRVEWDPYSFGLSAEYESITLSMAEGITDLSVREVNELPGNDYLVSLEADIEGEFDMFIFKADWYIMDDDDIYVWDSDWNDHYVAASKGLSLHCAFDLFIDPMAQKLKGVEITSVDPIC